MKTFIQFYEEAMAMAPTNNVGDGKIAGTVEAGDDPPVKKKKKKGKKKRSYRKICYRRGSCTN